MIARDCEVNFGVHSRHFSTKRSTCEEVQLRRSVQAPEGSSELFRALQMPENKFAYSLLLVMRAHRESLKKHCFMSIEPLIRAVCTVVQLEVQRCSRPVMLHQPRICARTEASLAKKTPYYRRSDLLSYHGQHTRLDLKRLAISRSMSLHFAQCQDHRSTLLLKFQATERRGAASECRQDGVRGRKKSSALALTT